MVRIKVDRVDQELQHRAWPRTQLIPIMGIAIGTFQNMFAGRGISDSTQKALFAAFDGAVPVEDLFEVVVEDDEERAA